MGLDLSQQRRQAHAYLDQLPAAQLSAIHTLLESMLDPIAQGIATAPVDDEEITVETAAALDRAKASLARGEGVAHEEILREFGLKR